MIRFPVTNNFSTAKMLVFVISHRNNGPKIPCFYFFFETWPPQKFYKIGLNKVQNFLEFQVGKAVVIFITMIHNAMAYINDRI